jgi:predicted DNA-binding transcriptional regulator AlpA
MNNQNLLVTLTTSDLRSLIADVLDEKLTPVMPQQNVQTDPAALYSRLEVAKRFGVTTTTIDKWRRFKILPPEVKIASRVYFYKEQIAECIQCRQRNPEQFRNL